MIRVLTITNEIVEAKYQIGYKHPAHGELTGMTYYEGTKKWCYWFKDGPGYDIPEDEL